MWQSHLLVELGLVWGTRIGVSYVCETTIVQIDLFWETDDLFWVETLFLTFFVRLVVERKCFKKIKKIKTRFKKNPA